MQIKLNSIYHEIRVISMYKDVIIKILLDGNIHVAMSVFAEMLIS